ncbi:MAG: branched-chain amino acid ABC transporter permease [Actinomycetota bacterium]|nr:branched-chain amino acid ABC transporter permease [Actinomycetota bacterium]
MSFNEISQFTVNGLTNGSFYGLMAVGFGLILGITGRFHFAFATTFIITAYVTTGLVGDGLPLIPAIAVGLVVAVILGILIERFVYRPLVERTPDGALLAVFVSALGITIIGENLIRLTWGSEARSLDPGFAVNKIELWGSTTTNTLNVVMIATLLILTFGIWYWMQRSRHGRAIRAVSNNPDMARIVGINPDRTYLIVFAIGSFISGVGAIFFTMKYAAVPGSASDPTFKALVITFLAGLGASPLRFLAAGVIVGLIESLSNIWISSTWNPVVTFGILFVYIAVVPIIADGSYRSITRRFTKPTAAADV